MRPKLQATCLLLIGLLLVQGPAYASDGDLDPAFGIAGTVTTDFSFRDDGANAMAIQPDGKIVVVGYSDSDFALARYNGAEPVRVQFDPPSLRIGSSFTATFLGSNLTNETYFDIQYRSPDGTDQVVLNWQQGPSASHTVPLTSATGTWTVRGIRVHQNLID